jgi:hypothetical protein
MRIAKGSSNGDYHESTQGPPFENRDMQSGLISLPDSRWFVDRWGSDENDSSGRPSLLRSKNHNGYIHEPRIERTRESRNTRSENAHNLEASADGAEVGLVFLERHVLVRLLPVRQRGVVGAEEDGDGRRVRARRHAIHGSRQHLEGPPRVVPAEPAQHHVRLTN